MRFVMHLVLLVLALSLMGVIACSPPSAPATPKAEAPPTRDLVAEVRAAGEQGADSLEVQPLRDAEVQDLRAAAAEHQRAGEFEAADSVLLRALQITPGDP
jgi:hypothetical protein